MITAGVHGDEYEPMLAAADLCKTIEGQLTAGKLTIVPVVNEPAFMNAGRCGPDGRDLARTCPGKERGSETEMIAAEISKLILRSDYYIDMHTGGLIYEIFPLAGYMLHSSGQVLEKQQMMAKAFALPLVWGTDPFAEGRTLSVARDANVPAIYVEYGGGRKIGSEIRRAYLHGCLNILSALKMIPAENAFVPEPDFWVEDYRLNNGHLQSKMPSPASGIFVPAQSPGSFLKENELFGTIQDPITGSETTVDAGMDGMVLFIRTPGRVGPGESLGGILPIAPGEKKKVFKD